MQVLKDEIRSKIYEAALKEFRQNGYEKASMRNIASRASITVGNMYRYFNNKSDLFYSIISPAYEKLMKFILEQKMPKGNQEFENIIIDEQANRLVEIYLSHRDELLIIIDGSSGSKYERAKDQFVKLVEDIIRSMLNSRKQISKTIADDSYFAHILSVTAIEGVILIFKHYEDEQKIRQMVQQFIGLMFKNINDRIK